MREALGGDAAAGAVPLAADGTVAAHVIWRLVDAEALLENANGAFADVFGPSGGILPMRPAQYDATVCTFGEEGDIECGV